MCKTHGEHNQVVMTRTRVQRRFHCLCSSHPALIVSCLLITSAIAIRLSVLYRNGHLVKSKELCPLTFRRILDKRRRKMAVVRRR